MTAQRLDSMVQIGHSRIRCERAHSAPRRVSVGWALHLLRMTAFRGLLQLLCRAAVSRLSALCDGPTLPQGSSLELRNPADPLPYRQIPRDFSVFLRHAATASPRSAPCSRRGSAGLRCAALRSDAMRPNLPVIPPGPAPRLCLRGCCRAARSPGRWHGGGRQLRNGSGWSMNPPGIWPLPCPPPIPALPNWSACWPEARHGISSKPRSARTAGTTPIDQEARA